VPEQVDAIRLSFTYRVGEPARPQLCLFPSRRTQKQDGTWLVHKRAVAFNQCFESGFPHGKFQISSFAGTSWATMALMLAESAK
jgi:hypothetical protein